MAARSPNRTSASASRRAPASRRSATTSGGSGGARGGSDARADGPSKRGPRKATGKAAAHKAPPKAISRNPLFWASIVGVFLIGAWLYPMVKLHYREQRQLTSIKAEYEAAKSRNAALRKQIQRLKTPQGIEQAARETLGLVNKGENAYVVMEPGASKPGSTAPVTAAPQRASAATDPVTLLLDAVFGSSPSAP